MFRLKAFDSIVISAFKASHHFFLTCQIKSFDPLLRLKPLKRIFTQGLHLFATNHQHFDTILGGAIKSHNLM